MRRNPERQTLMLPTGWQEKLRTYGKHNKHRERCSAEQLVNMLVEHKGATHKVAKLLGVSPANVTDRRKNIEAFLQCELPRGRIETWRQTEGQNRVIDLVIDTGTVIVGSDLHKWPDITGTAERAFIALQQMLKPAYTILNGDGLDGAAISRHGKIGWEQRPKVKDEIEALQEFSHAVIEQNKNGKFIRTRGNHDGRFDTFLSGLASELEGVRGTCLQDHLGMWTECVAVTVNRGTQGHTTIKHRFRAGGIHADWQNVLKQGCNIVFGHLHCQRVRAFTDARGTRYGVDAGMLAPVLGPQFAYGEADIVDHRSGFVVLTFIDGQLMPPELVHVMDEDEGIIYFRGQRWEV